MLETTSPGQCGRILVVDDDPAVRRSVTRLLRALGHQTLETRGYWGAVGEFGGQT
jgi:CheY-like chemotaxis protein